MLEGREAFILGALRRILYLSAANGSADTKPDAGRTDCLTLPAKAVKARNEPTTYFAVSFIFSNFVADIKV